MHVGQNISVFQAAEFQTLQEVKNSHLGGGNETKHHIHHGLIIPTFSILFSVTTILHHHHHIITCFRHGVPIVLLGISLSLAKHQHSIVKYLRPTVQSYG